MYKNYIIDEESEFKLPDEFISVWKHLKEMKE